MANLATITASNMLYAQAFKLDDEMREYLTARADRDRLELGETELQRVDVPVRDVSGSLIGSLAFML